VTSSTITDDDKLEAWVVNTLLIRQSLQTQNLQNLSTPLEALIDGEKRTTTYIVHASLKKKKKRKKRAILQRVQR